jgi:hypothetical protein
MWMSLSAGAPIDDRCNESTLDYDDVDDNVTLFHPLSMVTSVSGKSLRTAPPSSELSQPSQLPIGVITRFTMN